LCAVAGVGRAPSGYDSTMPSSRALFIDRRDSRSASLLVAIGLVCLGALLIALVSQHGFGIEPCAWCVMQRVVVIAIIMVAFVGALTGRGLPRLGPLVAALLLLALAIGGVLAAWYQHTVAAKTLSCAFTWADRTLMAWQLDSVWPSMFRVGATCADAASARLAGLAFEVWSGALFVIVAVAALAVIVRVLRSARR
jgi:disulfide bond formation protein DsbB